MKTVLYLDELLLVNFVAGASLLLAAGLLCGRQCSGLRLCLGSSGAAAASLALLAPEFAAPVALLYKVCSCGAVVALTYGVGSVRSFARLCVWYLLLNLLLCGAVLLPGAHSCNLSVYLPLSPGLLLGSCGAVYLVLRGVVYCCGRSNARGFAAVLELADGVCIPVSAFYDTGFSVQEPLTGRCVVLVEYRAVRAALPQALRRFLDGYFAAGTALPAPELGVRLVPCRTVAGHCLLPAVPVRALRCGKACARGLLAAFSNAALSENGVQLLLGSDTAQQLSLV